MALDPDETDPMLTADEVLLELLDAYARHGLKPSDCPQKELRARLEALAEQRRN